MIHRRCKCAHRIMSENEIIASKKDWTIDKQLQNWPTGKLKCLHWTHGKSDVIEIFETNKLIMNYVCALLMLFTWFLFLSFVFLNQFLHSIKKLHLFFFTGKWKKICVCLYATTKLGKRFFFVKAINLYKKNSTFCVLQSKKFSEIHEKRKKTKDIYQLVVPFWRPCTQPMLVLWLRAKFLTVAKVERFAVNSLLNQFERQVQRLQLWNMKQ